MVELEVEDMVSSKESILALAGIDARGVGMARSWLDEDDELLSLFDAVLLCAVCKDAPELS